MLDKDFQIALDEKFDPFALILLIRWLQHDVLRPDGESYTLERIAEDGLGITRHALNRFLQRKLNHDEEARRAREYAILLKPILDQGRQFPEPILALYESIYGDNTPIELDPGKPVERPEILRHRAMAHVPRNPADIEPLMGLSALVRISDDYVPAPELGEDAMKPGWAISILNVLPEHVQRGLNHPLFMLRQSGQHSKTSLTVQGTTIAQDDRFIFHGVDTGQRRPFHAVLPLHERWRDYRNAKADEPVHGSGLMMGLSSGRTVFAGLFDLFAIPDTVLPETATPREKADFRERYRRIVREAPGVRNLEDTIAELKRLGIRGGADWLRAVLRDMRDRTHGKQLLKP